MTASWVICHAFLQKSPVEKQTALLSHLPEKERRLLEGLSASYGDPTKSASLLDNIHASWLAPFLRNLPEGEISFFLSVLSEAQVAELKKSLLFSGRATSISPTAKSYLQDTLIRHVTAGEQNLLPISCLPTSALNPLLQLKESELSTILDFLGLHDLAVEMRHIIETAKLKKISESLSPDELNYVKMLMQSREPITFSRMGLANWPGDKEGLKMLIRKRGVNRFAKALYGQHPSFIWHLTHRFDVDYGVAIQKLCTPLENASATHLLVGQVVELLSFMRRPHE